MPADVCRDPPKRTCTDSDKLGKVFTDHPTLYFEDGNVILKCRWTLFCVHRTLLSKHSEVLQRIFTPAGPEAKPQEFFRGCLLIALDDEADDIECLLNTIYDGLHIDFPTLNTENFPKVAALLRMSTKYKLNRPRAVILDCLRSEWPSTLLKHDAKTTSTAKHVDPAAEGASTGEDTVLHPAGVISLLRECDYSSPDLLAPLFYSLSTIISQFTLPPTGHNISALSTADTERFIIGLNKLRSLHIASSQCPVYAVIHPPPAADTHQSILCQYELLRYWHNIAWPRLFDAEVQMCHPIEDWRVLCQVARADGIGGNVGMAGEALCNDCKVSVLNHIGLTRQKMWNALPELFGLT